MSTTSVQVRVSLASEAGQETILVIRGDWQGTVKEAAKQGLSHYQAAELLHMQIGDAVIRLVEQLLDRVRGGN